MTKIIRVGLKTLLFSVVLFVLLITVLSFTNISIPLEGVRHVILNKVSKIAGHEVRIDGQVRLAVSFFPTLVVDHLRIANAPGWPSDDILSITEARVQLALIPLFSGAMEFTEISASGVQINLQQKSDGSQNWKEFFTGEDHSEKKASNGKFWIEEFNLSDLVINYTDEALDQQFSSRIDWLVVYTQDKAHLTATLAGFSKDDIPYSFSATSDLLRNLSSKKPWNMSMQGEIAGKPVKLSLDINNDSAHTGTVKLDAEDVNIGQILSSLGLVDNIDLYSQSISFDAKLIGSNVIEILDQSSISLTLKNGYWVLKNLADKRHKKITFSKAMILSNQKKPVNIKFKGDMDGAVVALSLSTNNLSEFLKARKKIHLNIFAEVANATIKLTGDIVPPLNQKSFVMDIDISGEKLSHWNEIIDANIPSFGPYSLKGNIRADNKGFLLNEVQLRIGSSDLGGNIYVKTSDNQTHWNIDLVSQAFQIKDFAEKDFSFFMSKEKEFSSSTNTPPLKKTKINSSKSKLSATISLDAKQVLSGEDRLGHGKLQGKMTENSFSVEHFNLDIPGGKMKGALTLQKAGDQVSGQLSLHIDKFEYGTLSRYLQPDSTNEGLFSTRVNLQLKGKDIKHVFDHANGEIDFVVWPKNISANVLNVWAVNLFFALLPQINKKDSTLNCTTALLDIKDGVLTEELIFIDTTKIWMKGNVDISYPEKKISLILFPKAKKAKLFGLQIPIRLSGTFSKIGVTVKTLDLVKAYALFITSPLHVPFRSIFKQKPGEDLSELCGELLDREALKAKLQELKKNIPTRDEMYEYE